MIETNLTTVDVATNDNSVAIIASTPFTTTVVVGDDGVVALNTTVSPGVEVQATSPATVNISVVQESAVVITADPTNDTTVIVGESGVVTVNTVLDTPVQITTEPQQLVVLEPLEEVAVVLVTPAAQGPAGPQGPIGPSGGTQSYQVSVNLGAHKIVAVHTDGTIVLASSKNIAYFGTVVGMTTTEYHNGDEAILAVTGLIENQSWSLTPGDKVYLDDAGDISQTLPTNAVFSQVIGTALTTSMILLNIEPPTLLNGGVSINAHAALHSSVGTVLSTSTTVIDSFSAVTFRSAKYQIQIADGYNFETLEMFVLHDGVGVFMSQYGNVFTGTSSLGFFDALLTTNTVSVTFTASLATPKTIKFIRSAIQI